jgi:hypothetical protein
MQRDKVGTMEIAANDVQGFLVSILRLLVGPLGI